MSEPNYAVIRDPDEPSLSGRWFDLSDDAPRPGMSGIGVPTCRLTYVPTPFIEVRDDGAVAQVYMRSR